MCRFCTVATVWVPRSPPEVTSTLHVLDELRGRLACHCSADHASATSVLQQLLLHPEARVRLKTAELLVFGMELGSKLMGVLLSFIVEEIDGNIIRKEETRPAMLGSVERIQLDDTDGWSSLETPLVAFHSLLRAAISGRLSMANYMLSQQLQQTIFLEMAIHRSRYHCSTELYRSI